MLAVECEACSFVTSLLESGHLVTPPIYAYLHRVLEALVKVAGHTLLVTEDLRGWTRSSNMSVLLQVFTLRMTVPHHMTSLSHVRSSRELVQLANTS